MPTSPPPTAAVPTDPEHFARWFNHLVRQYESRRRAAGRPPPAKVRRPKARRPTAAERWERQIFVIRCLGPDLRTSEIKRRFRERFGDVNAATVGRYLRRAREWLLRWVSYERRVADPDLPLDEWVDANAVLVAMRRALDGPAPPSSGRDPRSDSGAPDPPPAAES
jgi:hypothetical protein